MKRLAAVLMAFLGLAAQAEAAITHQKSDAGSCNATQQNGNMSGLGTCNTGASHQFQYTPSAANDGVVFWITCGAGSNPSTVSLSEGSGTWNGDGIMIPIDGPSGGGGGGWIARFYGYTPDTAAVVFDISWGADCAGFMNDIVEEFSGTDLANLVDVAGTVSIASSGGCPAPSVTPSVNDTAVVFFCNDNVTGVGAAYTKGGDDLVNDWGEWKILTGGSGTPQSADFTHGTPGGAYTIAGMTVKPSTGAAATPKRTLLGVGTAAASQRRPPMIRRRHSFRITAAP
jgi:hypothetical protein